MPSEWGTHREQPPRRTACAWHTASGPIIYGAICLSCHGQGPQHREGMPGARHHTSQPFSNSSYWKLEIKRLLPAPHEPGAALTPLAHDLLRVTWVLLLQSVTYGLQTSQEICQNDQLKDKTSTHNPNAGLRPTEAEHLLPCSLICTSKLC